MTRNDPAVQKLSKQAAEALEHLKAGRLGQARSAYEKLRWGLVRAKKSPVHALWGLGETAATSGDLEAAMTMAQQALQMDPIDPRVEDLVTRLAQQLRALLAEADGVAPASGERARRLYSLLGRSGDTDVSSHLAMAVVFLREGDTEAAKTLLEALALVEPYSPDVWRLLSALASSCGDGARATDCLERAAACARPPGLAERPAGARI